MIEIERDAMMFVHTVNNLCESKAWFSLEMNVKVKDVSSDVDMTVLLFQEDSLYCALLNKCSDF